MWCVDPVVVVVVLVSFVPVYVVSSPMERIPIYSAVRTPPIPPSQKRSVNMYSVAKVFVVAPCFVVLCGLVDPVGGVLVPVLPVVVAFLPSSLAFRPLSIE